MNIGWRQTRIFTSDFSDQWYFDLLTTFVVPFVQKYPETPFWFTRYTDIRNRNGEDISDTEISKLPTHFLKPQTNEHFSLRLRFCSTSDEEAFLVSLFTDKFWKFDFRNYDVLGEFGSSRFCPSTEISARLKRMSILVRLFHANSLFILDSIVTENGVFRFEENIDSQNKDFYSTTFFSTVHLLVSVAGTKDRKELPVFWQHPDDEHRFIHATFLQ